MDMTQPPGVGVRLIIRRAARFGLNCVWEHFSGLFYSRAQTKQPAELGP
jgi:hypothetical protein